MGVATGLALLAAAVLAPGVHAATVRLPDGFEPTDAAAGAEGSVWLAGGGLSAAPGIVLLAPGGGLRSFPSPGGRIGGLAATADGTAWFTDTTSAVGRITASGDVRRFDTRIALPGDQAFGAVAAGAPGHLWFDAGAGRIGELAADGSLLQVLPPPPGEVARRLVAADATDALWIARRVGNTGTRLSRLAPDGSVLFAVDLPRYADGAAVRALAPDGALWVAAGVDLARVAPDGALRVVDLTGQIAAGIESLAFDGAGTLWFGTSSTDPSFLAVEPAQLGALDPAGAVTLYPQAVDPLVVAVAGDGALWFAARTASGGAVATRTTTPPPAACVVPEVYGRTLAAARSAILGAGCSVASVRGPTAGVVWGVSPIPDTVLAPSGPLRLQLGRGPAPVTGTWRGFVTTEQCNENGGTTPSNEYVLGTLRVERAAGGSLVARFHGRRLALRRQQGATYRFAGSRPGTTLVLKREGTSASLAVYERSGSCPEVATTGDLRRTAAR